MLDLGERGRLAMEILRVKTERRTQLADVAINEHADPDVASDLEGVFDRLVPHKGPYRHAEGNTDSHAKTVMVGASQVIFVEGGKLVLGTWQGIFFCEFDGPRERKIFVRVEESKG